MIYFGTAGWRGRMGKEFTFKNVRLVSLAFLNLLKKQCESELKIGVSYDTRYLSNEFANEISNFLSKNNVKVFLSGTDSPLPALSYKIIQSKLCGGIMVTASNNPPLYNGLKILSSKGASFSAEEIKLLEKEIKAIKTDNHKIFYPKKNFIKKIDFKEDYIQHLKNYIDFELIKSYSHKVIFDPMFGTSRNYIDSILKEYSIPIISIHNYTDPRFGGSLPILSIQSMKELKERVVRESATMGIAIDVDGDRFGIIDDKGRHLNPNYVLAFLLNYIFTTGRVKGKIAKTVATSSLIDSIASSFKTEIVETPVGTKYISNLIAKGDVCVGIEHSAGIWCKNYLPERDAVYASLMMLEAISYFKKPLSLLVDELFRKYGKHYYIERRIERNDRILDNYRNFCNIKIDMIGGIKVLRESKIDGRKLFFEDGSWMLVRKSGTEPAIRVYAESKEKKTAKELIDFAMEILNG